MKQEICTFSGVRFNQGRGRKACRLDGKVHTFFSKKCERSFFMKRNSRSVCWTVFYRRKNKKGIQDDEKTKKRSKRYVKPLRAVAGNSKDDIINKRNQKAEFRQAIRDEAVRAAKELNQRKEQERKMRKATSDKAKSAPKTKAIQKNLPNKPVRVGGKR